MKKQWNNPTISQLSLAETQHGPTPTTDHDMTTYDNNGEFWAGGKS